MHQHLLCDHWGLKSWVYTRKSKINCESCSICHSTRKNKGFSNNCPLLLYNHWDLMCLPFLVTRLEMFCWRHLFSQGFPCLYILFLETDTKHDTVSEVTQFLGNRNVTVCIRLSLSPGQEEIGPTRGPRSDTVCVFFSSSSNQYMSDPTQEDQEMTQLVLALHCHPTRILRKRVTQKRGSRSDTVLRPLHESTTWHASKTETWTGPNIMKKIKSPGTWMHI